MIMAILAVYGAILVVLQKLGVIVWGRVWALSFPVLWLALQLVLLVPMGWGSPQGPAIVLRNTVSITPNVSGEVIEIVAEPNTALAAGDVLFRIDPTPYDASVRSIEAQLALQERLLANAVQLQERNAGRAIDVIERQAAVDSLRGQLQGARWNLDKTTVRAPGNGFVTNVALRRGAHVGGAPVMAFVDTSTTAVAVEISQNNARYIAPGQPVEIAFKFAPGSIHTGRVTTVIQAMSTGQVTPSGLAATPTEIQSAPFIVVVELDDQDLARRLPLGASGDAAIFTEHQQITHVLRRIALRMVSIVNYVNPF
jgi:RND family efflux transporter MFP subunit